MLRLLLEHGADPTLATYADETPLSIVEPDSAAHELLLLHLADVQGLPAPPWKFHGPSILFGKALEFSINLSIFSEWISILILSFLFLFFFLF